MAEEWPEQELFIPGDELGAVDWVKLEPIEEEEGAARDPPGEGQRIKNRLSSLYRARTELTRVIQCNQGDGDCFLTLTFRDNIQDVSVANYEFKKFLRRLQYRVRDRPRYVCVTEFQKRGAIHFHVYLFGVGFIDWAVIQKSWGNGFIRINKISDPLGVSSYVTRYLVKDLLEDYRLAGKKVYFGSKWLRRSTVIVGLHAQERAEIREIMGRVGVLYQWQGEGPNKGKYEGFRGVIYDVDGMAVGFGGGGGVDSNESDFLGGADSFVEGG